MTMEKSIVVLVFINLILYKMHIPEKWIIPFNKDTYELCKMYRDTRHEGFWTNKEQLVDNNILASNGYLIGEFTKLQYKNLLDAPTITKEQLSYILGIKHLTMKEKIKLLKI